MKRYLISLLLVFLFLFCIPAGAQQVLRDSIPSRFLGRDVPVTVIVPTSPSAEQTFPVVYLLHGYNMVGDDWLAIRPDLPEIARRLGLILVCPGVGNSWYLDCPADPNIRCESFMTKELISFIDSHFPTIKNRRGRAITGLSMGGFGSLHLAGKYKELFGCAGSTSGPVDILPFPNRWGLDKVLGSFEQHADQWKKFNILSRPELFSAETALIFDCGTDDFFHEGNARLHDLLLERGVPHTYISQPGTHKLPYWRTSILQHLIFFAEHFREASHEVKH